MKGFPAVLKFFEKQYPLNEHGLEELFELFQEKEYSKNTRILTHDTEENQLRFLSEGVVREYYFHGEKETNINFLYKATIYN